MATTNQSPSYLKARAAIRNWALSTRAGQYATAKMKQFAPGGNASRIFDDDSWTNWDDFYEEHKDNLCIAANNQRARQAFERGEIKPSQGSRMLRFFSPPLWYVLRRQVETADPQYWNEPRNVLQEAINNPEWCTVPEAFLRKEIKRYLPKGAIVDTFGEPFKELEPEKKTEAPAVINEPSIYLPPAQTPAAVN